jgi:hypothetical protein
MTATIRRLVHHPLGLDRDVTLPTRQQGDGYVEPDLPLRVVPTPF